MLRVYLICVGKLKERFYQEACAEYVKRLSPYCITSFLLQADHHRTAGGKAAPSPLPGPD